MTIEITTIVGPEVVKMRFYKKSKIRGPSSEHLTIDCPVAVFNARREVAGYEFGRQNIAIAGSDPPGRPEFLQDRLFEIIG
jgi:hypothetical protein